MKIREFKENDWFFNEDGKLCQMMNVEYRKGSYNDGWCYTYTDGYFETTCGGDSNAYPLTLHNKIISDNMREYWDKFHKKGILFPLTGNRLITYMDRLMSVDQNGKNASEEYCKIYDELDAYMADLEYHISFFKEVI